MMRRNEARNLIPEDQLDENDMEQRVSRTEADIAKIEIGMREFRADMKAANEAIVGVKIAVTAMDGKLSALNAKIDTHAENVEVKLDAHAETVNARFDTVDVKLGALDAKIDAHAEIVEAKIDAHATGVNARFDTVDARLGALDAKIDAHAEAVDVKIDAHTKVVNARFDTVESTVGSLKSKVDEMSTELRQNTKSIYSLGSMLKAVIWLLTAGFGSLIALATLAKIFHWM